MLVLPVPSTADAGVVYRLAPLHALPAFDASVTLKHLLPTRLRRAFERLLSRWRWLCRLLYFLGLFFRLADMALPPAMVGGSWLVLSPLTQALPVVFTALSLRREFLSLMARTFDFWFFGLANVLSVVGFGVAFRDARVVLLPLSLLEIENARLSDAHCGSNVTPYVVGVAALGAVYFGGLAVAVGLHATEIHSTVLWRTRRGLVLRSEDVLVNVTATLALLLARLAYRKRDALRRTRGDATMVQCIGYRCRLKFVAGRDPNSAPRSKREDSRVQLLAVVGSHAYEASECVFGRHEWRSSTGLRWFWLWKLAVVLVGALTLFHVVKACLHGFKQELSTRLETSLLIANAAAHVAATVPLFAVQQRRRISWCFDIVFLTGQIFSARLVVCFLFHWALGPVVIPLGVWLWLCVIAASDALSPVAKKALGLPARRLALVVLLLLLAQLLLVADLAFFGRFGVTDRPLVDVELALGPRARRLTVFAMPFLFSRTFTIVVSCRVSKCSGGFTKPPMSMTKSFCCKEASGLSAQIRAAAEDDGACKCSGQGHGHGPTCP